MKSMPMDPAMKAKMDKMHGEHAQAKQAMPVKGMKKQGGKLTHGR